MQFSSEMQQMFREEDIRYSKKIITSGEYHHADRDLEYYIRCCPVLPNILARLREEFPEGTTGLDAGCGTGRAAKQLEEREEGKIHMLGSSLIYFPPLEQHEALPKDRIVLAPIDRMSPDLGPFHLITAVGSLDTTWSVVSDGIRLIERLHERGYLIIVETTSFYEPSKDLVELMKYGKSIGMRSSHILGIDQAVSTVVMTHRAK